MKKLLIMQRTSPSFHPCIRLRAPCFNTSSACRVRSSGICRRVLWQKVTDVHLISRLVNLSALKMEEICSSENPVHSYQVILHSTVTIVRT
jgi:hypothetical protein